MAGFRRGLFVAAVIAVASLVPAGAPDDAATHAVLFRDGDHVILGARGAGGSTPAEARQGYSTYGDATLRRSYRIRLVDSPGIDRVRPHVESARDAVTSAIEIDLRIERGDADTAPATGYIDVEVTDRSPCTPPWLGCGAPVVDDGKIQAAKVWLNPRLLHRSPEEVANTVRHELGHAFGLGHYDHEFDGRIQTMHSRIESAPRYESGDVAGLVAVSGRPPRAGAAPAPEPGTGAPATPVPGPGGDPTGQLDTVTSTALGIVVRGRATDPDTTEPVTVVVTMDGRRFEIVAGGRDATGDTHGFEVVWPVSPGFHQVCVHATNVGRGADTTLGCRTLISSDASLGHLGVQPF